MTKSAATRKTGDEKTRRRIIAYAERVFRERGFRKVSVEELCAGLAMSKRTFYANFADRDELVASVGLEALGPIREAIFENLQSDRPVEEVFRRHFDLLLNGLFSRLSMQFLTDIQTLMPEVWAFVEEFRGHIVHHMIELLRRGQREGSVRPDIDPETFGRVFQGLLQAFVNPVFVSSLGLSLQQVVSTFQKIVTGGILVPSAKEHCHEKPKKSAH